MAAVALVGTLDTKGPDFAFLAGRLRAAGAEVIVVDAGDTVYIPMGTLHSTMNAGWRGSG